MKIKKHFKKSLSRQFNSRMKSFILLFVIGATLLLFYQNHLNHKYVIENEALVTKERIAQKIDEKFNKAFFDVRGYFAFGNETLKTNALEQEEMLYSLLEDFKAIATTKDDHEFILSAESFIKYYFTNILPGALENYASGDIEAVVQKSKNGATAKINEFQTELKDYRDSLDNHVEENFNELSERQQRLQIIFFSFLSIMIVTLFLLTRTMLARIGQPLESFAIAANEIAEGREAKIEIEEREDEIGALSRAFLTMIESIQANEEELMAQNEQLQAQQDELHAQQTELEDALEQMRKNELSLKNRNELIEGISTSLEKQVVLDSIIVNMCKITRADLGIIAVLHNNAHASFGITNRGVTQFLTHLKSGLIEKLTETRKPFIVKRNLEPDEKGFHERELVGYDLYLPIFSSDHDLASVIVLSRYGQKFSDEKLIEYDRLSKQIGISLEKIKLHEKTEEERLVSQDILNTIQEGIQLVDLDGNIVQANDTLCDIATSKENAQAVIGLSFEKWSKIISENVKDSHLLVEYFENALYHNSNNEAEFAYVYQMNGSVKRTFKVYSKQLYKGYVKTGTIFVHRDITKEYEVDQMKSEFVSTVSHELRTPLASVLGFTELMINRQLKPERQLRYLNTIYQETKRLTALINDFLDVQRMEAGKQSYEKKYIDIIPIVKKVLETNEVNNSHHHFELESRTVNTFVLGDQEKIHQVLNNVMNNAVKYSPDGGNVNVIIYEEDKSLKMDISDEGLGIPDDALDQLFTKFFRVDNSDRRKIGGTGLGLSIVKEIMNSHDGDITVKSHYGKGSTFTLHFPLVKQQLQENERKNDYQNGYNIVVIEDDESLTKLLSEELYSSGFNVRCFTDGPKAIDYIIKHVPDGVVLDIMLGQDHIDGWKVMQQLKNNKETENIPIFVSTALDEKEKGKALGANDYLLKPYQPSQLSHAIKDKLFHTDTDGKNIISEEE